MGPLAQIETSDAYPLVIITAYNRRTETMRTLNALNRTTALGSVNLVVVNDCSEDDTHEHLVQWMNPARPCHVYHLPHNIGCPRALNYALARHRSIGQPVVKIDNDVEIQTAEWVPLMSQFLGHAREALGPVGMVMAYYPGCTDSRLAQDAPIKILGHNTWLMSHIIGHAVWHAGELMDEAGFFDVLADGHRYGFEDLLVSVKAERLGLAMVVWEGWQIENIQRHNSLGEERESHVQDMRPLYHERRAALLAGGSIWTNHLGQPRPSPDSIDFDLLSYTLRWDLENYSGQVGKPDESDG